MIEDDPDFKLVSDAFPHIGKKISVFWGHPEFVTLMFELQNVDASRPRSGFPGDVLFALMRLEERHDSKFPHLKRKSSTNWHTL